MTHLHVDPVAAVLDAEVDRRGGAAVVLASARTARHARHRGNGRAADDSPPLVRQLDYVVASDLLPDVDESFDDELVEGVLPRGALVVLYGESGSGKTFLATDAAAAIARGTEWLGHRTACGLVLYLATESPASVQMRLRAYMRHHQVQVRGFVIVRSPINLFDNDADVTAVLALVTTIEQLHGEKVALIIGDTLARLAAGANENAGEDMGTVIAHVDAIRAATGAAFMLIHHCGKDPSRGARGWSGLRAAADTEIEVTLDEATGMRSAEIVKQRDLPGKGARIGFQLVSVRLGANRWGTDRGSCVVQPADAPAKPVRSSRPSPIEGAIEEFLTTRGAGCLRGALAKHFEGRFARTAIYRTVSRMVHTGLLIEAAGVVALPGKPKASAT